MSSFKKIAENAKNASKELALVSSEVKNSAISLIAHELVSNSGKILNANAIDVKNAKKSKISEAAIDRLMLDGKRIEGISTAIKEIISLNDPVGETIENWTSKDSLEIQKVRVPLGVVGIIYEARPNVTVDAAVLCLKSGNAVLLKGSASTENSNKVLVETMQNAISKVGISKNAIQLLDSGKKTVKELLKAHGLVDVVIPRGGSSLIKFVVENSRVPIIETGSGICSVFVDESANIEMAEKIVVNAKCQRPSVCNAAEKLLVHEKIANQFLPKIAKSFAELGVEIRADKKSFEILQKIKLNNLKLKKANSKDFEIEFLDLIMAIAVVKDVFEAIEHINLHGSHHSEAIISENNGSVEKFFKEVDSANVFHNASTRLADGGVYGFGAEMGISNQKLHARGPFALKELTTYKYLVEGKGQIRK